MAETTGPQPPGRGKLIVLTVMITTLFWTIVWGGYTLARGRPQQVAFAVQPPPATATPAPTATPVPTVVANTPTVAAAAPLVTAAARTGFIALETPHEELTPAAAVDNSLPTVAAPSTGSLPASAPAETLININTGTAADLETLPGIGPKTAEAIIAYRDEHGLFATVEALTEVKGIGPATLEKLRSLITVD